MNLFRTLALSICLLFTASTFAHHVSMKAVFLNPGFENESFWHDVDEYMRAAANQMGVELTIHHGNRDVEHILKLGETIAKNANQNHYVFLVNEKNTGQRLFDIIGRTKAKIFFVLNDLNPAYLSTITAHNVRDNNAHYLGSLIPNNHWAGYHVAKAMDFEIRSHQKNDTAQHWLAISGDTYTPASLLREQGMLDYIKENPHINLIQTVYGEWQEKPAEEKTRILLARHPKINGIWTANDHMAFGAINALKEKQLVPGQDVILGTFNSSPKVLNALANNEISALGAGHFMAGGWALILAYDHFHGSHANTSELVQKARFFELVNPEGPVFDVLKAQAWHEIQFGRLSRTLNPQWQGYSYKLVAN